MTETTRKVDNDPLKNNYIEDLGRRKSTKFTREEKAVDKALIYPFL